MDPRKLSHELRTSRAPDLRRRRWVIGLSLLSAAMGQVVALYQTGLLRDLPDPPGPFDSARVDASRYAYRFGSPDGPIMVASYAVTAWLASAGRAERSPALALATAAKTVGDLVTALELAREEWAENGALCAYCQVATVASAASVAAALPEAVRAARTLRA